MGSSIKKKIPKAHIEACKDVNASIEYCQKENNFFEKGDRPPYGGKNRYTSRKSMLKEGANTFAFDDIDTIKKCYKGIDVKIFTESRNEVIKELLKEHYKNRYKKQDYSWIDNGEITNLLQNKTRKTGRSRFFQNLFGFN